MPMNEPTSKCLPRATVEMNDSVMDGWMVVMFKIVSRMFGMTKRDSVQMLEPRDSGIS